MLGNSVLGGNNAFAIKNSLRLRASASAYLSRTFASTPTTFTVSFWVKRGTLGATQRIFGARSAGTIANSISFTTGDILETYSFQQGLTLNTTAVFRDPSAWYHFVVSTTTGNTTTYCNNVQVATSATAFRLFNSAAAGNSIGRDGDSSSSYLDGYLSEVNFIDGQALTPTSFGLTDPATGQWMAKRYAGTYGTNGFYLPFNVGTSAATLAEDRSGNANNWTPTNISVAAGVTYDWMLDVPLAYGTTDRGNYCTLNPLDWYLAGGALNPPTSGNLGFASPTAASAGIAYYGTIGVSSGKWYYECLVDTAVSTSNASIGFGQEHGTSSFPTVNTYLGVYSAPTSSTYKNSVAVSSGLAAFAANDIVGVALDLDGLTAQFYRNGATIGAQVTGLTSGTYYPLVYALTNASAQQWALRLNCGQRPFTYSPPAGFKALHTGNMAAPAILNPKKHFDVVTRVGFGASGGSVTSLQFSPDFLWQKPRNLANPHLLIDRVRGAANYLQSQATSAEASAPLLLLSFDSNGYTFGSNDDLATTTVVDWSWKAGGAAVTNTRGSITSQVSANPVAGFSIVTFTGTGANATVGHGLGVAPKMVIVKARDRAGERWPVYHASLATDGYIALNETSAVVAPASTVFRTATFSSSVFAIGANASVNNSTTNYVAYCFAEVPGFSKFGSYTGNGSADGPFVYCGFRPRFVMIKNTTTAGTNWLLWDTSTSTYNASNNYLIPNTSGVEQTTGADIDVTASGFKVRNASGSGNTSSATHIFMAIAESPFGGYNSSGTNAR